MPDDNVCFVISPIGDPGSEVRRRADQVLKYVIEPACIKCGYTALRADKISEPGNITSQVIQHVLEDPIVIADLTGSNGNVFYELALRHAIRKPFIQVIELDNRIPFDIQSMRIVAFNHCDLDSVHEAVEEIERQIKAVEGKSADEIESPVTVALDFQSLRQSGDPEQRSIAEFANALSEVRIDLKYIRHELVANGEARSKMQLETEHNLAYQIKRLSDSVTEREIALNELYKRFAEEMTTKLSRTKQEGPPAYGKT